MYCSSFTKSDSCNIILDSDSKLARKEPIEMLGTIL